MTRWDAEAAAQPLPAAEAKTSTAEAETPGVLLLEAREVPLGGLRGMQVHRSLPQRNLPTVGAWCFLDRFGPQSTIMRVEPHPHIGLQTVTWPLVGEVRHRDTVGSDVVVRRGALDLMTSGAGIAHSEYSVGDGPIPLDALQLWVALPESRRHGPPAFEQHEQLPQVPLGDGTEATVVMGSLAGVTSPASTYTPLVGAELRLAAGARVRLPLAASWEHAVVGVTGEVMVTTGPDAAVPLAPQQLLYLAPGHDAVELTASAQATVFFLGGEPFESDIVMWWNFVGRSHEEIVEAREAWEADSPRFGHVVGHGPERVPAPPLPAVRLRSRRRRS
ncbi:MULTISPECIES: pirin family protein [unclassified Microbacterium]|uniref:pirin family protein n=1 Tax=unclassified Microbacterium TaxID=2609290 RepID=UPI00214C37C3|nr:MULTISPECIES: pirin family protein [unclassified Microbacterium]MCR2784662.1 pirin family protein [Microbacterium sp. zg.B96]MDL5352887.1 pirin family protein [Microbacterium sp. zg-YB36]WIM16204.1 pirin family protein [Microbacterium sp. zg-B96]